MQPLRSLVVLAAVVAVATFVGKRFIFGGVGGWKGCSAGNFELQSLGGRTHRLCDEAGKVVVVDMWATWCPPCRASLPHLQQLSSNRTYAADGLVVWAVNDQEPPATIAGFLAANHYTFTVLTDPTGSVLKQYGVSGIPTTLVIGRDGVVRDVFVGYGPESAAAIENAVLRALGESAAG